MRRGLLALVAHIYLANHPRGRSPPGSERAHHACSPRNPNLGVQLASFRQPLAEVLNYPAKMIN